MAAKYCVYCKKDLGMFSLKTSISDGFVCASCLLKGGIQNLDNPANYNTESITQLINNRINLVDNFKPTKKVAEFLKIDENNKSFKIGNNIFSYQNLIDFELIEDGETITKGGLGRAVAGGLLFGGVGAVVGGVTGGKKTKGVCTSLKIKVTLYNAHCDCVYIPIISTQTKKSGFMYKTLKESADNCVAALQIILNEVQTQKNSATVLNTAQLSAADEILKFKNLLDQGIISQAEFDKKKSELLGL